MAKAVVCVLLVGLVMLGSASWAGDAPSLDDALLAFQETRLDKARRMAEAHTDKPMARLIVALCQIHDTKNQDLAAGMAGLKSLADDEKLDAALWAQAALAYGRAAQLIQVRGRHPQFDAIDVVAVYGRILEKAPDTAPACRAVMALAEKYCDSKDKAERTKGPAALKAFLARTKAPARETVPVRLMAGYASIAVARDYAAAVDYFKGAYKLGIAKAKLERETLFRIGRILDVELKRKAEARRTYQMFVKKYPYAQATPVVQRYLREMEARD